MLRGDDGRTDREDLVRQCLTIGHEAIVAAVDSGVAAWADAGLPVASIPLVDPAGMRQRCSMSAKARNGPLVIYRT